MSSNCFTVTIMPFGKYKGEAIAVIAEKRPQYIKWLFTSMSKDPEAKTNWADLYETLQETMKSIN